MATNMSGRPPIEMTTSFEFFVFNPTFGTREGEEEKMILYYYPNKTPLDSKLKQIGFCGAAIAFLSKFSRRPAKSVKTSQSITVFLEGEPDFWLILSATKRRFAAPDNATPVSGPGMHGNSNSSNQSAAAGGAQQSGANCEKEVFEEDELQSSVYEAFVNQLYTMFRFFTGGMRHILSKHDVPVLRERLSKIFSRYFTSSKLDRAADPLSVFPAIRYQPLDRSRFLKVACFINEFEYTFQERYAVRYTMVYHGNRLVWSSLPTQSDTQIASYYLVNSLFNAYFENELHGSQRYPDASSGRSLAEKSQQAAGKHHYGKFVTGLQQFGNMQTADHISRSPKVYIRRVDASSAESGTSKADPTSVNENNDKSTAPSEYDECYLVVYAALRVFLCVFVSAHAATCSSLNPATQFSRELDEFLGRRLSALSTELSEYELSERNALAADRVSESAARTAQLEAAAVLQNYRFVYFNNMNLSIRSTLASQSSVPDNMPLANSTRQSVSSIAASSSSRSVAQGGQEVSVDVLRSLVDLRADLCRTVPRCAAFFCNSQAYSESSAASEASRGDESEENDELCYAEIVAQTAANEHTIVSEKSDQRELHIVGLTRNASLIDTKQDVKRLVDTQLPNIFFLDS